MFTLRYNSYEIAQHYHRYTLSFDPNSADFKVFVVTKEMTEVDVEQLKVWFITKIWILYNTLLYINIHYYTLLYITLYAIMD